MRKYIYCSTTSTAQLKIFPPLVKMRIICKISETCFSGSHDTLSLKISIETKFITHIWGLFGRTLSKPASRHLYLRDMTKENFVIFFHIEMAFRGLASCVRAWNVLFCYHFAAGEIKSSIYFLSCFPCFHPPASRCSLVTLYRFDPWEIYYVVEPSHLKAQRMFGCFRSRQNINSKRKMVLLLKYCILGVFTAAK